MHLCDEGLKALNRVALAREVLKKHHANTLEDAICDLKYHKTPDSGGFYFHKALKMRHFGNGDHKL